jgi:hypothetical protein
VDPSTLEVQELFVEQPRAFASRASATDQQNYTKLIAKIAPPVTLGQPFKPRVACVCPPPQGTAPRRPVCS